MTVLGIESSCDETAVAVVQDGDGVLASVVYSQIALHRPYGGVVPEVASRAHVAKIRAVAEEALAQAFPGDPDPWARVDAIAATRGPGLAAALLVGWTFAKGLALATGKPLVPVNHMHAHLWSVRLGHPELRGAALWPQLGLAVSGGHTCFVASEGPDRHRLLGQTIDDAAGEAFDKAAKLLGLGYPGGPVIDKAARQAPPGADRAIRFPEGRVSEDHPLPDGWDPALCVSFSGLKTALLTHVRKQPPQGEADVATLCASYQAAIVGALAKRADRALASAPYRSLALGGGVSLNRALRDALAQVAARRGVRLLLAEPKYCGDNAAMIAGLASALPLPADSTAALALDVDPSLPIGSLEAWKVGSLAHAGKAMGGEESPSLQASKPPSLHHD